MNTELMKHKEIWIENRKENNQRELHNKRIV